MSENCKVKAEVFLVYWLWETHFHTVEAPIVNEKWRKTPVP